MKYFLAAVVAVALLTVGVIAARAHEDANCLTVKQLIENIAPEAAQYNIEPTIYTAEVTAKIVAAIPGAPTDGDFVSVVYRLEGQAYIFFFEKEEGAKTYCFVARVVRPVAWLEQVLNG